MSQKKPKTNLHAEAETAATAISGAQKSAREEAIDAAFKAVEKKSETALKSALRRGDRLGVDWGWATKDGEGIAFWTEIVVSSCQNLLYVCKN